MVTPEVMKDTVLIDGGLVAMQFMLAARAHGYDTCPIGGFEKDQIAEAFGLDKESYRTSYVNFNRESCRQWLPISTSSN